MALRRAVSYRRKTCIHSRCAAVSALPGVNTAVASARRISGSAVGNGCDRK
jgi:hypothetical protein